MTNSISFFGTVSPSSPGRDTFTPTFKNGLLGEVTKRKICSTFYSLEKITLVTQGREFTLNLKEHPLDPA
jgi:hypothetical protein